MAGGRGAGSALTELVGGDSWRSPDRILVKGRDWLARRVSPIYPRNRIHDRRSAVLPAVFTRSARHTGLTFVDIIFDCLCLSGSKNYSRVESLHNSLFTWSGTLKHMSKRFINISRRPCRRTVAVRLRTSVSLPGSMSEKRTLRRTPCLVLPLSNVFLAGRALTWQGAPNLVSAGFLA